MWWRDCDYSKVPREKIIVFDVETTGLYADEDEILQVSAIDGNGKTLINTYVKPTQAKAWPRASRVNGITPETVKDAPTFSEIRAEVQKIFDEHDYLVGYNVFFDIDFLRASGIEFRNKIDEEKFFDVMEAFAVIYGEWNDYYESYTWQKLITCADYYGFKNYDAHDSFNDCRATLFCFKKMLKLDKKGGK